MTSEPLVQGAEDVAEVSAEATKQPHRLLPTAQYFSWGGELFIKRLSMVWGLYIYDFSILTLKKQQQGIGVAQACGGH